MRLNLQHLATYLILTVVSCVAYAETQTTHTYRGYVQLSIRRAADEKVPRLAVLSISEKQGGPVSQAFAMELDAERATVSLAGEGSVERTQSRMNSEVLRIAVNGKEEVRFQTRSKTRGEKVEAIPVKFIMLLSLPEVRVTHEELVGKLKLSTGSPAS